MKVLVTGGAGFIGSHLVRRLLELGHHVRVIDNFTTGRRSNLAPIIDDIELVEGDLQSYERASRAVRDVEAVLHQAAMPSVPRSVHDPLTSNAVNVVGTLNLLLAARDSGTRRVVVASSSSVYGRIPDLPKHEALPTLPISPYAVAKLAAENYARAFNDVYGLETVALRYFNVFGPNQDPNSQYAAVIPRFITSALTGARPTVYGDGEQTRDFTYVANVVDGNVRALDASKAVGLAINLACGERVSLNRLLSEIGGMTGQEMAPIYEHARAGDVRDSLADVSLAARVLGFHPCVGLRDGLQRTLEHLSCDREDAPPAR